jgi:hypothetical protein
MGLGHLTSQPLKNSSKQESKINRRATTKYLKNEGMHRNYQNGSILHPASDIKHKIFLYM